MKAELIRGRRYSTELDLRYDLVRYINKFYNENGYTQELIIIRLLNMKH